MEDTGNGGAGKQGSRPERYPYQDIAANLLTETEERRLTFEEKLRLIADLFEAVAFQHMVRDDDRLDNARGAWLALGSIVEATEPLDVLTCEEREKAGELVRVWHGDPTIEIRG